MRKSFTRLFGVFLLFVSMLCLNVVAQGAPIIDPIYSGSIPENGDQSAAISDTLVLEFGTHVGIVTNKSISLSIGDTANVATFVTNANGEGTSYSASPVDWKMVVVGDTTVKIIFQEGTLKANTSYVLTIQAGAFSDEKVGSPTTSNSIRLSFKTQRAGNFVYTSLDPVNGAENVETNKPETGFNVTFNRPVLLNTKAFPLSQGDIAIYGSNNTIVGDSTGWGSILSYTMLNGAQPTFTYYKGATPTDDYSEDVDSTVMTIKFARSEFAPDAALTLAGNSLYYIRIKNGLLLDQDSAVWEQDITDNTSWLFSTRKVEEIGSSITVPTGCVTKNQPFYLKINTAAKLHVVNADEKLPFVFSTSGEDLLTVSNIAQFVTVKDDNDQVIAINNFDIVKDGSTGYMFTPKSSSPWGDDTEYTVSFTGSTESKKIWSEDYNPVDDAESKSFVSGDYTSPAEFEFNAFTPDATSFQSSVKSSEAGTLYYIVTSSSAEHNVANIKAAVASPAGAVFYKDSVEIEEADSLYNLERHSFLPITNGTEYYIFYYVKDTACSRANESGVSKTSITTLDGKSPVVTMSSVSPLQRKGSVAVSFDESVETGSALGESAANKAITPEYIKSAFIVNILNEDSTLYEANYTDFAGVVDNSDNTKKITLSFSGKSLPSGKLLEVVLNSQYLQDISSNANLVPEYRDTFLIETYVGPIAKGCDVVNSYTWPEDSSINYAPGTNGAFSVVFSWDLPLYDASGNSISNDPSSDYYVGNYVTIYKTDLALSYGDPRLTSGDYAEIINNEGTANEMFIYSYDYDSKELTVSLLSSDESPYESLYESETWYYFQIEPQLVSADGLPLSWKEVGNSTISGDSVYVSDGACSTHNFWTSFKTADYREPVCYFYESESAPSYNANKPALGEDFNLGDCENGEIYEGFDSTSIILVSIDEWISLGFDSFKSLDQTDTIDDANALRPYFKLVDSEGNNIKFDVKGFFLDSAIDVANFYIDPYENETGLVGSDSDNQFNAGETYTIYFRGKVKDLGANDGGDIFADDAENYVGAACASFVVSEGPAAVECISSILASATLNGQPISMHYKNEKVTNINLADTDSTVTVTLKFKCPVQDISDNSVVPNGLVLRKGSVTIATAVAQFADSNLDSVKFEFDLKSNEDFVSDTVYELGWTGDFKLKNASGDNLYFPRGYEEGADTCGFISPVDGTSFAGVDAPISFYVLDQDAPKLVAFNHDTCLIDRGMFNEVEALTVADSTDFDEDLMFKFDKPIVINTTAGENGKYLGMTIYLAGTHTQAVSARSITCKDSIYVKKDNDSILVVPASVWYREGKYSYDTLYYITFAEKFVLNKNNNKLGNLNITQDSLHFSTILDPAPVIIVCGDPDTESETYDYEKGNVNVSPYHAVPDTLPEFSISFKESVTPVSGKAANVYAEGNTVYAIFSVSDMESSEGGKKWILPSDKLRFFENGVKGFKFGNTYRVSINSGAFKDMAGQETNEITSYEIANEGRTGCNWQFTVMDAVAPVAKLWPNDGDSVIPVNSYLYAYFNEMPYVWNKFSNHRIGALQAVNKETFPKQQAGNFFSLIDVTDPAAPRTLEYDSEWFLESIGLDQKIQYLRVVVEDSAATGIRLTGESLMKSETKYEFSFHNEYAGDSTYEIRDFAGNRVLSVVDTFVTEDITSPSIDIQELSDICGDTLEYRVVLSEPGTVTYEVFLKGVTNPVINKTSVVTDTDNSAYIRFSKAVLDAATKDTTGYDFEIRFSACDDEVDIYTASVINSIAWPFVKGTDEYFGDSIIRVQDIIPAPNYTTSDSVRSFTLCDDDAPILSSTYPSFNVYGEILTKNFSPKDSIVLKFNEKVALVDNYEQGQGYSIMLRDYDNNLAVPLAWAYLVDSTNATDSSTVILYPLEGQVGSQLARVDSQFVKYTGQERGSLESDAWYYIEIERNAISDLPSCDCRSNFAPFVNYVDELVGKDTTDATIVNTFKTGDGDAPYVASFVPAPNSECVTSKTITLTFNENISKVDGCGDVNAIVKYRQNEVDAWSVLENIPFSAWTVSGKTLTFNLVNDLMSEAYYRVEIPRIRCIEDESDNKWKDSAKADSTADATVEDTVVVLFRSADTEMPELTWSIVERDFLDVVVNDDDFEETIYGKRSMIDGWFPPFGDDLTDLGLLGDSLVGTTDPKGLGVSSYLRLNFSERVVGFDTSNIQLKMGDRTLVQGVDYRVFTSNPRGPRFNIDKTVANTDTVRFVYVLPIQAKEDSLWCNQFTHRPSRFGLRYGFLSEKSYELSVDGLRVKDLTCSKESNELSLNNQSVVKFATRDDEPPFITNSDVETCIGKDGVFEYVITFDTLVVKTPYADIDYDGSIPYLEEEGINWRESANTTLTPDDIRNILRVSPRLWNRYVSAEVENVNAEGQEYYGTKSIKLKFDTLVSEGVYSIDIRPGVVRRVNEINRSQYGNIFLGKKLIFKVTDYVAPSVVSTWPANDQGVDSLLSYDKDNSGLWIEYDEEVARTASTDSVVIRWLDGIEEAGQQAYKVSLEEAFMVDGMGSRTADSVSKYLFIPFSHDQLAYKKLLGGNAYYVTVPAGAVTDSISNEKCVSNVSSAINSDNVGFREWYFHIKDEVRPLAWFEPNHTHSVSLANKEFAIHFDENVRFQYPDSCLNKEYGLYLYRYETNQGDKFGDFVEFVPFAKTTESGKAFVEFRGTNKYGYLDSNIVVFHLDDYALSDGGNYYIEVKSGMGCRIVDRDNNPWEQYELSSDWFNLEEIAATRSFNDFGEGYTDESLTWAFETVHDGVPYISWMSPYYDHVAEPGVYRGLNTGYGDKGTVDCLKASDRAYADTDLTLWFGDATLIDKESASNKMAVMANPSINEDAKYIRIKEYVYNPVTFGYEEKLWKKIDITDTSVVKFEGNKVTIKDVRLRDGINGNLNYFVTIDDAAIVSAAEGTTGYLSTRVKDYSSTDNYDLSTAFGWRFQTCSDEVFLCESEVSMEKVDSIALEDADKFSVSFAEAIEFNEGGTITVARTNAAHGVGDEDITISVNSDLFDIVNNEDSTGVIIAKEGLFTEYPDFIVDEATYTVTFKEGAVADTANVHNKSCEVVFGFTTGDNTAPVAILTSNTTCLENEFDVVLSFDETKGINIDSIDLNVTAGNAEVTDINIDDTKTILTVSVKALEDDQTISLTLVAGSINDNGNNHLANEEDQTWNFIVADNTKPTVSGLVLNYANADSSINDSISPIIVSNGVPFGDSCAVMEISFSEPVDVNSATLSIVYAGEIGGKSLSSTLLKAIDPVAGFASAYRAYVSGFTSETDYLVIVADSLVFDTDTCDVNYNDADTLEFSVGDIDPFTAEYKVFGITNLPDEKNYDTEFEHYRGLQLEIIFSEEGISAGDGFVTVHNATTGDLTEIAATEFISNEDGSAFVYTNSTPNVWWGSFYVTVDGEAFLDPTAQEVAKHFAGLNNDSTWIFSVIDTVFCGQIIPTTPLRSSIVDTISDVTIRFAVDCEDAIKAGRGYITVSDQDTTAWTNENNTHKYLYQASDLENVKFFEEDGVNYVQLTVPQLEENTKYSIIISEGAVVDEAGNECKGIIDANEWWFQTPDLTDPTIALENEGGNPALNVVDGTVTYKVSEAGVVYILAKGETDINKALAQKTVLSGGSVVFNIADIRGVKAGEAYDVFIIDNSGRKSSVLDLVVVDKYNTLAISEARNTAAGVTVRIQGTVTAIDTDAKGFFMQDKNTENSGIYVNNADSKAVVNRNSSIELIGTVSEVNGLKTFTIESAQACNPVVEVKAVAVKIADFANLEKYESMLVSLTDTAVKLICTEGLNATTGEWKVADHMATNAPIVVDQQCVVYTPVVNHFYLLRGVVNQNGSVYAIAPTYVGESINTGDIFDRTLISVDNLSTSVKVYPNPFSSFINIEASSDVRITKAVITNIAGQLVKEVANPGNKILTNELRSGVYIISLHTENGIAKTDRIIKR